MELKRPSRFLSAAHKRAGFLIRRGVLGEVERIGTHAP
jgi:hypothetical protein